MEYRISCNKHVKMQDNTWKHEERINPILDVALKDQLIDADSPEEAIIATVEYLTDLFALNAMGTKFDKDKLSVFISSIDYTENRPFLVFDHFCAFV